MRTLKRCFYHFKALRIWGLLAPCFIGLFFPAFFLIIRPFLPPSIRVEDQIAQMGQMLIPFLTTVNIFLVFREYLDGDGSEILFVYGGKIKLFDALLVFFVSILLVSSSYLIFMIQVPNIFYEWLRIICDSIFFFGLCYLLLFLTKSVPLTSMVLLSYALFATFYCSFSFPALSYYSFDLATPALILSKNLPFAIVGIAMTIVGVILNRACFYGSD